MPNLTLTHNGNMNITNADITSSSTLSVSYEPNNTGAIAGWSSFPLPGSQYETGDTITVRFTPDITGNVLSETFVVSGIDKEGVRRSGTSVLRQGYDSDLRHYISGMELTAVWNCTINSTAATSNYLDVNLTVSENPYSDGFGLAFSGAGIYSWYGTIDLPDTGSTVVSSITISVASDIIDSGVAYYSYSPVDAIANVSFSSSDPDVASIDPTTGEITVFQDGIVQFCVTDSISELQDCATVEVFKTPDTGDTGTVITYLELNVPSQIIESGIAVPVYAPSDVDVSFVFTSSDPSVATIDEYGNITVLNNGSVTFCVLEEYSGLVACKTVIVRKAKYINSIEIDVPDSIFVSGVASSIYTPADASVWLIYTSSDPSIASIDPNTGEITANESGTVTFCVRDLYTNLSDCKEVTIIGYPKLCVTYNTDDSHLTTSNGTFVFNGGKIDDTQYDFFVKAEYNGTDITDDLPTHSGSVGSPTHYQFPAGGNQTICYTLNVFDDNGELKCYIPDEIFTTPAFGSNVADFALTEVHPSVSAWIGYYAFSGTPYLENVVIPDGWNFKLYTGGAGIGQQFYGCTNLKTVVLGSGVTQLGKSAFANCTRLTSVTMTDNLVWLGSDVFGGCTRLSGITLSNNLYHIEDSFYGCTSLREITLPTGIRETGMETFRGCTSLVTVNYPNDLSWVPEGFCRGCTSLTGFTFPAAVTSVQRNAFAGCSGLTEMRFLSTNPPGISGSALGSTGYTFSIYVPCGSFWKYRSSSSFTNYKNRLAVDEGCSTAITIEATYYVTSTTQAINILTKAGSSFITKKYLEDGTEISTTETATYIMYQFQETGYIKIYYDSNTTDLNQQSCFSNLPDLVELRYLDGFTRILSVPVSDSIVSLSFGSTIAKITYPIMGLPNLSSIYCYSRTAPTIGTTTYHPNPFEDIGTGGVLYYPRGSNYKTWYTPLSGFGWISSPTL